jgi:uncharacterized damage-inducible protein DinB
MRTSLLSDAFAHHVWATERLIDACAVLSPEQLATPAPGTYGSIIGTLRHLVGADGWYLSFYDDARAARIDEEGDAGLPELRAAMTANGPIWLELLAGELDPDADVVEIGDTGWEFHAPTGIRLAQVLHHGTDHRSQMCTVFTSLGVTPPDIDVWDYADATGRSRSVPEPAP